MPELFHCMLDPCGPNFEEWKHIFGTHNRVPLKSAYPIKATLGEEKEVEVYWLNVDALTLGQRARLFYGMAQRFRSTVAEIERAVREDGFPIRAVDVIVSYDMRAMV